MIVTCTDFGTTGPYLGQVHAVLARAAPGVPVIDLFADAPAFDPQSTGYLLAAYATSFPLGTVFLCVVDPGVGTGRAPVIAQAGERWYVGPDNGLLDVVVRRARGARWWDIDWRPAQLSASFHGRDLFAPVAALLARGGFPEATEYDPHGRIDRTAPEDLAQVVYIDVYGNAMTGWRAENAHVGWRLLTGGRALPHARTFGEVQPGTAFWYGNSNGLVEIAVNRGSAAATLGLAIGSGFVWE